MSLKKWMYLVFINLLIVALLGVLLRYKITFSLPFFNQKYLQHGHSHFALTGWITQALMVLISYTVSKEINLTHFKKHQWILIANLIASVGMLISFPIQGYGSVSIAFSSLSILVSYIYALRVWRDVNCISIVKPGYKWFKAALLFLVLSSVGIFFMVYLMITKNINPNFHLAAVYMFLHFQYNGWFVFSCLGLIVNKIYDKGLEVKGLTTFFWINAIACVPAYYLSAPWLPIPKFVFVIVVLAAIFQLLSWLWIAFGMRKMASSLFSKIPSIAKWLFSLSALAYTLKVSLQLGSTIPALSEIAFGFRPIVVAYLHLVFLGVISLFILGYALGWVFTNLSNLARNGMIVFVVGIILNETALMVQGVFAIGYHMVPYINEVIFGITVVMLSGVLLFNIGIHQKEKNKEELNE
ncbi:MAG TPA: hypothetical protein VKZ95_02985 [Sphingobacteriaceae bacterium]|nr:hypothetical protein [Sphingobacteriaceae bacterium]